MENKARRAHENDLLGITQAPGTAWGPPRDSWGSPKTPGDAPRNSRGLPGDVWRRLGPPAYPQRSPRDPAVIPLDLQGPWARFIMYTSGMEAKTDPRHGDFAVDLPKCPGLWYLCYTYIYIYVYIYEQGSGMIVLKQLKKWQSQHELFGHHMLLSILACVMFLFV